MRDLFIIQPDSEDNLDNSDTPRRQSLPATFRAIADFEGLSKDRQQNVFTLQKDEEVQVVEKSESGE